jgi:hypothetical protein
MKRIALAIAACCTAPAWAAGSTSFNPDLSLILDGRYASLSEDPATYALPGFQLSGEAGPGERGLALGHSELVMSANVDDLFYGKLTAALHSEGTATNVELEEAYVETLGLGQGFTVRAGRAYSGIGYLNAHHPHAWDFTDAPLVYRGLFGDQLRDDGVQLRWVAPTDLYVQLGAEVGRGEFFPAGGAANDGRGTYAAFVKLGGDLNDSHSWQLGLSHWHADVNGRSAGAHDHGGTATEIPTLTGNSTVNGIDFVWKWAPLGNPAQNNFKFQAEYFQRREEGDVELVGAPTQEITDYSGKQSGWYAQAAYQFMPHWRVGVRYDQLQADNSGSDTVLLEEAGLDDTGYKPSRSSVMIDWSHSEYSRVRLQFNQDKSRADVTDNQVYLQYVMSLGAHGAHQF